MSFDSLLPYINKQLGIHHIRTKFHLVHLKVLNRLSEESKVSSYLDFSTPEYRLNSMFTDIVHHRLF